MSSSLLPAPGRRLVLAFALGAGLLSGCAGGKAEQRPDVVWPLPPEKARVKFLRAFAREDDLNAGGFQTALRVVIPASPDAVIQQPTGLALSPDGRFLYVTCASVGRVIRVDLRESKLEVVSIDEGKQPASPFDVAVDGQGNLYISDMVNHAVWAYTPAGKFLLKIPVGDKPTGVAVDPRRQLLYVVVGVTQKTDHRVEVFSLKGQKLRTMGTRGIGPGQFNFPTHLAVGRDGNLYVVDMLNFRVQVFDPEGQLVTMFGMPGAGEPGTFDKAKGVALDGFGNVYVTDSQQGTVQIFNPAYQPLLTFAGRATLPGYLLVPGAIAIDARNTIYVADFAGGSVNEYQLINTTAEDSFLAPPEGKAEAGGPTTK